MKTKIKIRDLTSRQFDEWEKTNCKTIDCVACPFRCSSCGNSYAFSFIYHKDMFSDKFLDQEIEIDAQILDKEEKEYLEVVLKPFKDRIISIEKHTQEHVFAFISVKLSSSKLKHELYEEINFPYFRIDKMYNSMAIDRPYTLKDLGLFE